MNNVGKSDIYKSCALQYMYSSIVLDTILTSFYTYIGLKSFMFILIGHLITNVTITIYIFKKSYESFKNIINPYLILLSLSCYYVLLCFWEYTPLSFMWYILFPVAAYVFFSLRIAIYWILYIIVLVLSTFIVKEWFTFPKLILSQKELISINIFFLTFIVYFLYLFFYYAHKLFEFDLKMSLINTSIIEEEISYKKISKKNITKQPSRVEEKTNNSDNDGISQLLYDKILDYFENQKPYIKSDFTISKLADELDTNVSYISRTLNSISDSNFNAFINKYRIKYVKQLIEEKDYDRFKLTYLYNQAGFMNQSTFNKAFKKIEGITPTEYLLKIRNK